MNHHTTDPTRRGYRQQTAPRSPMRAHDSRLTFEQARQARADERWQDAMSARSAARHHHRREQTEATAAAVRRAEAEVAAAETVLDNLTVRSH